jgi:hypothetical protein
MPHRTIPKAITPRRGSLGRIERIAEAAVDVPKRLLYFHNPPIRSQLRPVLGMGGAARQASGRR